ncbi:hypothetical protein DB459_02635 [Bradyrhizobium sp. WD16]|nr:hypothetical protein DB459_02635 [Bradyrhizobium sp. WD16]
MAGTSPAITIRGDAALVNQFAPWARNASPPRRSTLRCLSPQADVCTTLVMAGLVPAIHVFLATKERGGFDIRYRLDAGS